MVELKVSLPESSVNRIDELVKTCGYEDRAQVIASALRVFESLVKLSEEGHKFLSLKYDIITPLDIFE